MRKRRFTAEFKKDAARMMIIEGLAVGEVSEQLGVAPNLLYRWKTEHLEELESSTPEGGRSLKEMVAEIERLRKELAKSQRMNQILKKRWASSARTTDAVSIYQSEQLGVWDR